MISIRPYMGEDCLTVLDIFNRSIREIACRDYSPAQIAAWAPISRDMKLFADSRAGKPTFVAEIDSIAAGFADLENDGHIDFFYVHPAFQRQGVGRSLLVFLEDRARQFNSNGLHAEVSITARPLFERHGFCVLAEQQVHVRGETLTNYRMEKRF